jgi:RHS repeat-associated protein
VAYTYDDGTITQSNHLGQLSKVTNGVVTTTYNGYDANGQLLSVSKTISGDTTRTTAYTFDLSGKPLSTIYPDSYQLNHYYYAGTGLLQSVVGITDMTNYVTYEDYPATGRIKKAVYGNNTETTYTRDSFSTRLTAILTKDAAGAVIMDRSYGYTPAGDIEDINDNVKGTTYFYDYDKLHRLIDETNSGGEDDLSYAYNDMGGFTTKSKGSVVMSYSYDTAHVHAVKTVTVAGATHAFDYDANGNMIAGPDLTDLADVATRTIAYNSDNMPAQIEHSVHGITTFTYDGGGSRAKKSGPNGTTYYYGALFEKQGGELVKYIFAGSQRVAMVKSGGVKYFHQDHLGSATVVTDASGVKVEEAAYLPFGGQRGSDVITSTNYGFTDQESDPETGLYNYDARLYDPSLGVFVSADTMVPYPFNSQSFNRYSYCLNNPLIYTDPTGYAEECSENGECSNDTDCGPGGVCGSDGVCEGGEGVCFGKVGSYSGIDPFGNVHTDTPIYGPVPCGPNNSTSTPTISEGTVVGNGSQSFSIDVSGGQSGGGDGIMGAIDAARWGHLGPPTDPSTLDNSVQSDPLSPIEIISFTKAGYAIGKIGIKYGIIIIGKRASKKGINLLNPNILVNRVFRSLKKSPNYPRNFQPLKGNPLRENIKDKKLLNLLRTIEPSKWQKVYKNGWINNRRVSIHYFESKSNRVFDVKTVTGWSTRK